MAARKRAPSKPPADRVEDLPVIGVFKQTAKVEEVDAILREHEYGSFARSAPLWDELMTDDRISGCMEQRSAGLLAAPMVMEAAGPKRKQRKLAEILGGVDKQAGIWPEIVGPDALEGLLSWGLAVGVGVAQIIWQKEPGLWKPTLRLWHPKFIRWDHQRRGFLLQHSQGELLLPRPDEQPNSDGQWVVWCPYGVQYGWNRALVRSLARKYVSRLWAERDWDRHNERQGMAILKALVPHQASAAQKEKFWRQVANIGSEAVVACTQGVTQPDGKVGQGYDLQVVEFMAQTFGAMKDRKSTLDVDIAVRILGQNLSTEVTTGSRAAAETHNLIRLDKAAKDSEIGKALRAQLLWWWAKWNHGDGELAPRPTYYVDPPGDDSAEAASLKMLGDALSILKEVEPRTNVTAVCQEWNVPLLTEEEAAAEDEESAAEETDADAEAEPGAGTTATLSDGTVIKVEGTPTAEEMAEILASAEQRLKKEEPLP